uniref:RNase H type-1 domain-containing protein n=1 Tax=Brassica campestris TaxID=3711 RepID=A0A3P5Y0Z3_BRACM|nr:unnamed protein product [Brassica rapa]
MHARDAFAPSPDKLSAEIECLLWVLRSLRDLRLEEVIIVIAFEVESSESNQVARKIAKSVLRDGQFQSYLQWEDHCGYLISSELRLQSLVLIPFP